MPAAPIWIAVPTYWTWPTGRTGRELTVFDHPTPLDTEGTLARALESFLALEGDLSVVIVAAATHPDLGRAPHERVASLIAPFAGRLRLYLASPANLDSLNRCLPEPILGLDSYGSIRNVQLAVPFAAGAAAVLGIDDDEVIRDAQHLAKVAEFIGRDAGDGLVGGMAGPYFDRDGRYELPGADHLAAERNIFLKKNYFMNQALRKAVGGAGAGAVVRSNVAFGGNMAMARATIARVCHDPYIPRGEDYDYVINAAMEGITFYFRPDMGVLHLPPDSTGPQAADTGSKLVADIRRFIYMREKIRRHRQALPEERLDLDYLQPYPGAYLDEGVDLCAHAVEAINRRLPPGTVDAQAFVAEAVAAAHTKAEEFFAARQAWRRAMAAAADDPAFGRAVEALRVG